MIECIFTVDYEIYGNGEGSLRELVLEPAEKLKIIFRKHNARFVVFVEAAELEIIGSERADQAIGLVPGLDVGPALLVLLTVPVGVLDHLVDVVF